MKELVERLNSKLEKYAPAPYKAFLQEGGLSDSIIIRAGDTKRFIIEKYLFGGYELRYYDVLFQDTPIITDLSGQSDIILYSMIQKIIIGDDALAYLTIQDITEELKKYKTAKEIREAYSDNEGSNYHDVNILLLALNYGTEEEINKIQKAMIINEIVGYSYEDIYPLHKKLYPKLQAAENREK